MYKENGIIHILYLLAQVLKFFIQTSFQVHLSILYIHPPIPWLCNNLIDQYMKIN